MFTAYILDGFNQRRLETRHRTLPNAVASLRKKEKVLAASTIYYKQSRIDSDDGLQYSYDINTDTLNKLM
jgi:hypothetical protein